MDKDVKKGKFMYFISRNNAVYHYIAHTNTMRRYIATLFFIITFGITSFYGIYIPLKAHITVSMLERARLQKQYEEIERMRESNKELLVLVDTSKKNINVYLVADDQREQECSKRMQFVFDTISKLGLNLDSYNACSMKDKKWYAKEGAHIQVSGTLEKITSFFKAIKDSENMVSLSHIVISRLKDNIFQLSCDAGIVFVKS